MIYGDEWLKCGEQCMTHLNSDEMLLPLVMKMLVFSTMDYRNDSLARLSMLENVSMVMNMQDRFVDLTWHYLCYRHGVARAMKIFADLIRSVFALQQSLVDHFD